MSKRIPSYRHHKGTGQAVVTLDGREVYLGNFGTPDSHRRYTEELSRWQARQTETTAAVTIRQLTLLYLKRCETHYRKGDSVTSEVGCVRLALKHLNRLYRETLASEFTPMMLAQVRNAMVDAGYVRDTINRHVGRIVRCWKWGVSQGLVTVTSYQALTTLQGLQAGRCEAKESQGVRPVAIEDVMALESGEAFAGTPYEILAKPYEIAGKPYENTRDNFGRICDLLLQCHSLNLRSFDTCSPSPQRRSPSERTALSDCCGGRTLDRPSTCTLNRLAMDPQGLPRCPPQRCLPRRTVALLRRGLPGVSSLTDRGAAGSNIRQRERARAHLETP